ncbi:MAG: flagellar basal body P-ring formation chaperone FlgA [Ignavibacteria bacterium]|nr:flagellar basal body P-ring formation chaperone FlgA [Ignavibacteria bacterium]
MKLTFSIIILLLYSTLLYSQTIIAGKEIRQRIEQEIRSVYGNNTEISLPQKIQDFWFSESDIDFEINFGTTEPIGNVIAGIEFRRYGNLLKRVEIPVRVKVFRNVLTASRTINRGEVISDENTIVQYKEISSKTQLSDSEGEEIYGKVAKHTILRGSIITKELLTEPFAIRRGDKIKIIVLSGSVYIQTTGVALQDGKSGELVRVRRDGTNTILTGLAAKDGSVIISN